MAVGALCVAMLTTGGVLGTAQNEPRCERVETVTILSPPRLRAVAMATAQDIRSVAADGTCLRAVAVSADTESFNRKAVELSGRQSLVVLAGPMETTYIAEALPWLSLPSQRHRVAGTLGVVAGPEAAIERLGWSSTPPTWAQVGAAVRAGTKAATLDPSSTTLSAATLAMLAVSTTAADPTHAGVDDVMNQQTVDALATLRRHLTVRGNAAEVGAAAQTGLAFLDEQQARTLPAGTRVVYPQAPLRVDIVATLVARQGSDSFGEAEQAVLDELLSPAGQQRFVAAGYRAAGDLSAPGAEPGEVAVSVPLPSTEVIGTVAGAWNRLETPGRYMLVIDVSGSMKAVVPPSSQTRMEIVQVAAKSVISWLPDHTQVGMWVFATSLEDGRDYRVVVPVAALADPQRARMQRASAELRPTRRDTGLYDTVLAATRDARRGYVKGQPNVVIVMTDGRNDDPGSTLTLTQLVATLKKEHDPNRPVRVMSFAYGDAADLQALTALSSATGGIAYDLSDPQAIRGAYVDVLGLD